MSSEVVSTPVTLLAWSFNGALVERKTCCLAVAVADLFFIGGQRLAGLEDPAVERDGARGGLFAEERCGRGADDLARIDVEKAAAAGIGEENAAVAIGGADHHRQRVDDLRQPLA